MKLKPCAHCGSKAKYYYRKDEWSNEHWICCVDAYDNCGIQTCLLETKDIAYTVWNRRDYEELE